MKIVKILYIAFISILLTSGYGFTQDVTQVTFLSELDSKSQATYGDALIIFKLQTGSAVSSGKGKKSHSDPIALSGYTEKDILTKGMASLMAARYLDLGGSFMYLIFDTERYAYKACIANGIFSPGGSENDKMTGPELIDLLSRISDLKGGK
jgi:hypothetical protein